MTTQLLDPSEVPGARAVANPFVLVRDAAGFADFVCAVFGAVEHAEARSPMPDGSLIHAEVALGQVNLMVADPQPGWPVWPGLVQVWVRDLPTVLERATARGSRVVTDPTPFYGETSLARMLDPWGTLWWLHSPAPGQADPVPVWEGGSGEVFSTLDVAMREIARTGAAVGGTMG